MNAIIADSVDAIEDSDDLVIVDDDKLTLEIVSWNLKGTDSRYKLFSDHNLAMSYLLNTRTQLLIVDYFMPEINGIDFLLELKNQVDLSSTSIFMCSAVTPRLAEQRTVQSLGASLLEKQIICTRSSLLSLIDQSAQC